MNKQTRIFVLIFLAVLFMTFFVFTPLDQGKESSFLERMIVKFYQPLAGAFTGGTEYFGGMIDDYLLLVHTKQENKALLDLIHVLRMQNKTLKQALHQKIESEQVTERYSLLGRSLHKTTILSFDISTTSNTIWIAAGKNQGVKINSPVVNGMGLIGRVIQVFDDSAQVLLAVDVQFSVDVVNERTGLRVLVRGMRTGRYQLNRLPFLSQIEFFEKGHEIMPGDSLISSGLNGIYPKGIEIGRVADIDKAESGLQDRTVVVPSVDFTKLSGFVFVML